MKFSLHYVKFMVHDLFLQDKALAELNCKGSPGNYKVNFQKQSQLGGEFWILF